MKILLVSSNSGSRGGGEIYLLRLAEGLGGLDHEVHLLLAADPVMDELAAQAEGSARVHRLELRNMYQRPLRVFGATRDSRQIGRLSAEFRRLRPDVVHLNQQVAEDGLDLLLAAGRTRLPTVSTIHIPGSPKALGAKAGGLREREARRILARSSALHIAVSRHSADQLAAWLPFLRSENRLSAVHNGVPTPAAATEAGQLRHQVRQQWGVTDDEIVLGCLGRIEAQKDPLFVVELLAALVALDQPLKVVWVGDGGLRGQLEAAVRRHGLGGRFVIDGWQTDAAARLSAFDIFLMPSRFEGLPLALLEALAAGLPSCANATDGIPEAITDRENGILCRPGDLAGWVETLSSLLADVGERRRLGAAAAESARQRFSVEVMARRTVEVYGSAIAHSALRSP